MASWNSIFQEMMDAGPNGFDIVRRKKLADVSQITGHHTIIYAADFEPVNPIKARLVGGSMSISFADKDGFDEITRNIPCINNCNEVDILLHSPGGSAEATESIVKLLRARFSSVRFIVPSIAKSAATMMAMSGNQILMDDRSKLGPIDPQLLIPRDDQIVIAPAQAIKDQFEMAQKEISSDNAKLPSWIPILRGYGPSLLAQCDNHLTLAEELVSSWLKKYMFRSDNQAESKANAVAKHLNSHNNFYSHSRRIGITELQNLGLNILDMRTNQCLHNAVRDLYSALMLTFANSGAYKIFENSCGDAVIQQLNITQNPLLTGNR